MFEMKPVSFQTTYLFCEVYEWEICRSSFGIGMLLETVFSYKSVILNVVILLYTIVHITEYFYPPLSFAKFFSDLGGSLGL